MSKIMMYRYPKSYKGNGVDKGITKGDVIFDDEENPVQRFLFDYVIIEKEMKEAAIKQGWRNSTQEAYELNAGKEDNLPATRAELEAKAKELGIKFPPNTKDSTLSAKIEEKLKA